MKNAYPLEWPAGWKRTPVHDRKPGRFGVRRMNEQRTYASLGSVTVAEAVSRLLSELRSLGVDREDVVISTNVQVKLDGTPYSNRGEPADGGAAVYWRLDDEDQCLAIDVYQRVADNLAALAATVNALRAIERHGSAAIMKRAFIGLKQLPASTLPVLTTEQAAEKLCSMANFPGSVLAVLKMPDEAKTIARLAIGRAHPDNQRGDQADFLLAQECKRILAAHHGRPL